MAMTHAQLVSTVRRRMRQLGMTTYRLHQLLSGRVSKQTVYNFVEHGRGTNSETLAAMMAVLNLTVIGPDDGVTPPTRRQQ